MSIQAVADTHALIWYLSNDSRLSETARLAIEGIEKTGNHLAVSAITLVEIVYLIEKNRIPAQSYERAVTLLGQDNAFVVQTPLDRLIVDAMRQIDRDQIPDMPDRIIAATARFLNVPVITIDGKIRQSTVATIW